MIQRCSGDLSLNVHFHSLVTDGVFLEEYSGGPVSFHELPTPTDGDVADVAAEVCRRTRDVLVRRGRWTDDPDEPPDDDGAPEGLADLYAASVRGILLLGPRRGQRIVRFFGECARRPRQGPESGLSGNTFNLHAGHTVPADDREGVERLARYILRPPIGQARLTRRADGLVALSLSRPWRDGTAGVLLPPLDFLARLVAAIPCPRTNTIRFHGVYAPHARLRRAVVPPRHEGRDGQDGCACGPDDPIRRTLRLSWAQLLQRVFRVDVFFCMRCASPGMQRIAWITDNETIVKILRAVGLPTDSPAAHPARRPDEAFE